MCVCKMSKAASRQHNCRVLTFYRFSQPSLYLRKSGNGNHYMPVAYYIIDVEPLLARGKIVIIIKNNRE